MRSHRKQPSRPAEHTWEAHSTYTAELGVPDRRRYRRTASGTPTVADLVRLGDTVSTSYSTGGVVIKVDEHFYAAPTGETLSHFTIVYVPVDRATTYRDTDHHWINECVAVDGRILMLFEANSDEVFVVGRARPANPQPSRTILIR
ncbi:hypothetical protein [Mesorhizobium australicum]|uniref:Uncharacterized protein n=1 Tax=Mesorhizobium australicum TaxID=536018 RepID=A0A1X7MR65_9HYPH|nr:hypothetical protein [Mesorhizobium australicum]SMH26463.1 hypothetical protein SAMN02982922_0262 [Mesorhizobium australicum]